MSRPPVLRASRRRALGGLLVGLAAGGCTLDPPREEPSGAPTTPGERATGAGEPTAEDLDAELVRRVVGDLTAALALVGGVARTARRSAREVAPWRALHAAHLEALEAPGRATPARVRGRPEALRDQVHREESALQGRLARAATSARSGALAALLATMSAAVAQRLAADAAGSTG